MVSIKFSVIFALVLALVVAEEFDTKAEIETLKRRMDNLESSQGNYFTRTFILNCII